MSYPWTESRAAFTDAAEWFLDTVGLVGDRWELPALGEWDVRSLVGHTTRAMLTVETYLAKPASTVDIDSPAAYFRAGRALARDSDIAARGREAGAALGPDPEPAVREIVIRVLELLDGRDGGELVTMIAGGMRLADYLPTRTFELTVHTADLAAALGLHAEPPASAAAQALGIVADLAVDSGSAGELLLGLTGRRSLPEGFSVL